MEEKIKEIFAVCAKKDASEITPDTRLDEDLELKSLDKFALLAMLEAEFGRAPDPNEADPWNLVSEWMAFYQE